MRYEPAVWSMKLGDLLDRASSALGDARAARRIVADVAGVPLGRIGLERVRPVEPERVARVLAAVERRTAGEPLEYVSGLAGFRHLDLRIDRRALIPRPETEGLVDRALDLDRTGVVVDVGTGSGCVALSLREEGRYRMVIAVDRSEPALGVARENRDRLGLDVTLVRGDLTRAFGPGSVDLLVSNPPYVSEPEYAALDPSVRDYEPRAALESGPDGLEATRGLLKDGARVVRPGGALVVEIAATRAADSAELARSNGWGEVRVDEDLFGRPRYLVARREESR